MIDATSRLGGPQTLYTDSTVQVLSVSKGSRELEGKQIVVRRPGGAMSVEGRPVIARDPDFPAFEPGGEYVLFVRETPDGHFVIPMGAQGAFQVDSEGVKQLSREIGKFNRERGQVPVLDFLNEIAAIRDKATPRR